jgi:glutamyl-Q tRNA(Asp) synthetase
MDRERPAYRGRFAPSPTGPLHFGSLVAAVASYGDALAHGGEWLVRMEDVDQPRTVPGAADAILRTLESCGFAWTGELAWQSRNGAAYAEAIEQLRSQGKVFACACSRREISDSALNTDGERVYPGTCRKGLPAGRVGRSLRVRVDSASAEFEDSIQGRIAQSLGTEVGDFILKRADGCFAYQLAVVVDDARQQVSHVVRGADLLGSTPRQIFLQRLLGFKTPRYAHVPVAVNAQGEKLSKQTLARAIDPVSTSANLWMALGFLGQDPPRELARASPSRLWEWVAHAWRLDKVPKSLSRPAPEGFA